MKTFVTIQKFLIVIFTCLAFILHGQVTAVKYMLKYDPKNDNFDCYLVLSEGFAKTVPQRTQFPSNVSIVVPSGTAFKIVKNFMPLVGNENFNSIRPVNWDITTKVIKPKSRPRFDYFLVTPDLTNEAHYNTIEAGDSIRLFSIKMDTLVGCADGIRLFISGVDPGADADDFLNLDFSQKFAMETDTNLYTTNAVLNYPPIAGKDENACKGQSISLAPFPFSKGEWYLPEGNPFGATIQNNGFSMAKVDFSLKAEKGIYTIVFADSNYYDFKCITITQPDVSITVDSISCKGGYTTLVAVGVGSYAWSPLGDTTATIRPMAYTTYTVTVTDLFGCTASSSIAVKTLSDIIIPGKDLCIGSPSYQLPDLRSGTWDTLLINGTWSNSNPAIATVTPDGLVTAVSQGHVYFIFSYGDCYIISEKFTSHPKPQISLIGADNICTSETTSFTATAAGQWISSSLNILTINNQGVATGINPGSASVTFIQSSTGCISLPKVVAVKQKPNVAITGLSNICVDQTTTLSPSSGGVWNSDNSIVASVDNSGIVTGLFAGTAQFRFLAANGCFSNLTPPVTVHPIPVAMITGRDSICANGGTTTLTPISGGSWMSSNNFVVSISNSGLVTGISPGTTTAIFTSAFGCVSAPSDVITVIPKPITSISGPDKICVGSQTILTANQTGSWISNFPDIASISPAGIITGLTAGNATFTFIGSSIACANVASPIIKVLPLPINLPQNVSLCMEGSVSLTPALNGTWEAYPTGIIQINNQTFASLAPGQTMLIFKDANTGCKSDSVSVVVHPLPQIQLIGNDTICVGTTTSFSASVPGSWAGSNFAVADINNSGLVTGIAPGSAFFEFSTLAGCTTTSPDVNVQAPIDVIIEIRNNQLFCPHIAGVYQWFDCSNNQFIEETTTPSFQPGLNGSYYLVIDDNICENQSDCIDFTLVSTLNKLSESIKIAPNPAFYKISITASVQILNIKVRNVMGQEQLNTSETNIEVSDWIPGMYFVEIKTIEGKVTKPIIIVE